MKCPTTHELCGSCDFNIGTLSSVNHSLISAVNYDLKTLNFIFTYLSKTSAQYIVSVVSVQQNNLVHSENPE